MVDPSRHPRYVAAVRAIAFASAGQELNIARSARGQAAGSCLGVALFALGKVTAGTSGKEGPQESITFVGPEER